MILIALVLLVRQADPLAENWTKLRDAWHAAADARGDGDYVDDKLLKAAAAVHSAFEATGLNGKDLAPDRAALRRAVKARLVPAVQARMPAPKDGRGGRDVEMEAFERMILQMQEQMQEQLGARWKRVKPEVALASIRTHAKAAAEAKPDAKAASEEKVAEALVQLSVIEKDAAPWVTRRVTRLVIALETKGAFPSPVAASPELQARVQALIAQLGDDEFTVREKALADLTEIGEAAVPQLREACQSSNAEIKLRARQLLGIK